MSRKAQSTTFVLVGIVVLALVVLVYVFRGAVFDLGLAREQERAVVLPEKAAKVNAYVESCINERMNDAIRLVSSQGGYTVVPEDAQPRSVANPFSNALDVFANGGAQVAYWWYEAANGVEKVQVPSLAMIGEDIAAYIDGTLASCVDGFGVFQQQGYGVSSGVPSSAVNVLDDRIVARVTLPVQFTADGSTFSLRDFTVTQRSSLGQLYRQAVQVMQRELDASFLEEYALDMMVVYDEIPFSGIDFECSPRSWSKTQVVQDFRNMLATNIPAMRVKGAGGSDAKESYREVDAGTIERDVRVNFHYAPEWPLLLDVLGEKEEILRGKPFTTENELSRFLAGLFCLNDYHFVYDVKFPVLVTLVDENDLAFQFATQVVIDHNQPKENAVDIPTLETDARICQYPSRETEVVVLGQQGDGSLRPVPGARVSYKCSTAVCDGGVTASDGAVTAMFPQCMNGFMLVEREGYLKAEAQFSTNQEGDASVVLEPMYALSVDAQVIAQGYARPVQPTEQAVFVFEHQDKEYATTVIAPGTTQVALPAGRYTLTSYVLVQNDGGFSFDDHEVKTCVERPREGILGLVGVKEKVCEVHTLEGFALDQVMTGRTEISASFDSRELARAQRIRVFAVRGETPKTAEDVTKMGGERLKNEGMARMPELS